ncbi:MAG: hypothetical protein WCO60_18355 [Verrucomicrobiota bacterium]
MALLQLGSPAPAYLETWSLDRYGVLAASMAQKVLANGLSEDEVLSNVGVPSHRLIPSSVLMVRNEFVPQDGGSWGYVRWYYEGEYALTGHVEYELDTSRRDVPVAAHPCIYEIMYQYDGWEDESGVHFERTYKPKGKGASGTFGMKVKSEGEPNPMFGIDSFVDIGAVWRITSVARQIPRGAPGKIVAQPPTDKQPPKMGVGPRNWMTMPVKARKRGLVYEVTQEWLLSGRGGWNEDIYG